MQDYYAILELEPGCTQQEIRKKYRKLALRYDRDHNAENPQAEETFKQIARAYETLGNPKKRKEYDRSYPKKNVSPKKPNTSSTTRTWKYSSAKTSSSKNNQTYTSRPPFAKILLNAIKKHPLIKAAHHITQKKKAVSSFLDSMHHKTKQGIDKKKRKIQQQLDKLVRLRRPKKKQHKAEYTGYFRYKAKKKQPGKSYQWGELDIVYITPLNKTELKKGKNVTIRIYTNATDEKYELLNIAIPPNSKDGQRLRIRGKGHCCRLSEKRGDLYLHLVQKAHRMW